MSILEKRFVAAMTLLCAWYLVVESVYISTLPLVMDEFQGAYSVSQLGEGLPYRDFIPYKTVVGYYLQLAVMQLAQDTWARLILIKASMAVMTAGTVFLAARILAQHYRKEAVCLATLLLFCMSTFLERSAELRVDMMTSMAGLLSLVFLLSKRFLVAGVLAGTSFLISQKGLFFIVAGGLSCLLTWSFDGRARERAVEGARFCIWAAAPILGYVFLWGAVSSFSVVVETVFFRHGDIALDELYRIKHYWFQTWERNPYFYGMGVLALGLLFARRDQEESGSGNRSLLSYGAIVLALGLWHKQPWPYFFVLIIPTVYVLIVALLDDQLRRPRALPTAFWVAFVVLGVAAPLRRFAAVMARDNGFQASTVRLAEAILEPGDSYLAGTQMLPRYQQPLGEHLGWLDQRHLQRLQLMEPEKLIEGLRASRLKLVIMNGRLLALPAPVRSYLAENYQRLHGAIHIYAPTIRTSRFQLLFDGAYTLQADQLVFLDGRAVAPGDRILLMAGPHEASALPFRMALNPDVPERALDPRYAHPERLFSQPYNY